MLRNKGLGIKPGLGLSYTACEIVMDEIMQLWNLLQNNLGTGSRKCVGIEMKQDWPLVVRAESWDQVQIPLLASEFISA